MLACIRCGACLNVCPVYRKTAGAAYGPVYSGPMGAVLVPLLVGLGNAPALPHASSLCGACTEACPVKIPLHDLLLELRRDLVEQHVASWRERARVRRSGRSPGRGRSATGLRRLPPGSARGSRAGSARAGRGRAGVRCRGSRAGASGAGDDDARCARRAVRREPEAKRLHGSLPRASPSSPGATRLGGALRPRRSRAASCSRPRPRSRARARSCPTCTSALVSRGPRPAGPGRALFAVPAT